MVAEEEEFEIKKTKKEKYSQIKYESNTFDAFTAKDIETFFAVESTMYNQDRLIIETYERKNELESLIYTWKEKINGNYREFAKQNEIPEILQFLEAQNEWLYNEGQESTRGVYNERISAIKNKIGPVVKRYDNFHAVVEELKVLEDCLKFNTDLLNSLVPIHLFRTKNTSTSRLRSAKRDSTTSATFENGSSTATKNKSRGPSTRTWR